MPEPRVPEYDDSAICRQIGDVDLFISANGGMSTIARRFCTSCPWIDECLEYAVLVDVYGVWGGTTRKQRKAIRADRGIEAYPAVSYWDHRERLAS